MKLNQHESLSEPSLELGAEFSSPENVAAIDEEISKAKDELAFVEDLKRDQLHRLHPEMSRDDITGELFTDADLHWLNGRIHDLKAKRRKATGEAPREEKLPPRSDWAGMDYFAQSLYGRMLRARKDGFTFTAEEHRQTFESLPSHFRGRAERCEDLSHEAGISLLRLSSYNVYRPARPGRIGRYSVRPKRGRSSRGYCSTRTRGSRRSTTGSSSSESDPGGGSGDPDPPGSTAHTGGRNQSLVSDRRCRS